MFRILGKEELEVQQWASNEKVINPCMDEGDEVVFVNGKGKHIVTQAYRLDGTVVADIPNDFLQHKGNILAYLEQGKDRHKECETTISVAACEKPSGYKCVKNEKVFPKNQPDWNQNDPTKPDYIKNKPDGIEGGVLVLRVYNELDGSLSWNQEYTLDEIHKASLDGRLACQLWYVNTYGNTECDTFKMCTHDGTNTENHEYGRSVAFICGDYCMYWNEEGFHWEAY